MTYLLRLAFDGANGSTTFTDDSPSPKTVSVSGGTPTISTAQSKHGGSSLLLPSSLANLSVPSTAFQFATGGAFTVQFYIRLVAMPSGNGYVVALGSPGAGAGNAPVRSGWAVSVSNTGAINIAIGDFSLSLFNVATTTAGFLSTGTWYHVAVAVNGSTVPKIFIDGVSRTVSQFGAVSWASVTPGEADSTDIFIGKYDNRTGTPDTLNAYIDDLQIEDVAAYSADFTPPGPFAPISAYSSASGPLGAPSVLGAALVAAMSSAAGPLGAVRVVALQAIAARVFAPSPLSAAPAVFAIHDFSVLLDAASTSNYLMDLTTPGGVVRVPISSWQATLRAEEDNYVQCVVPACQDWVETIAVATAFEIIRRAVTSAGDKVQIVIASAPLEAPTLAQGANNYSATLSGYSPPIDAPAAVERALTDIRTVFTYSTGYRVRCAIDWLLRPGHTATFNGTDFQVRYISYYVQGDDAFMDVGQ